MSTKLPLRTLVIGVIGLGCSLMPITAAEPGDERWDFRFGRPGADNAVLAAVTWNGHLCMGGRFQTSGGSVAKQVALWSGFDWYPLGDGLERDAAFFDSSVNALAVWRGTLFAGGNFTRSGSNILSGLACWDGTNWLPVGGLSGVVQKLASTANDLYVVGTLVVPGQAAACGVARWDGQVWESFGSIIAASPYNDPATMSLVAVQEPQIYVSGNFTALAGQPIRYTAEWTGTNWQPFGNVPYEFGALTMHEGKPCASFWTSDNAGTPFIGTWDGTNWQALGIGLGDLAEDLVSDGTNLFATGPFINSGPVSLDHVARWDGTNWLAAGTSVWEANSWPPHLALDDDDKLYGLGSFSAVQGQAAASIAVWDGQDWSAVGPSHALGLQGAIGASRCLAASGTRLYVGGLFTFAGSSPADCLAVLESNRWSGLGHFSVSNQFATMQSVTAAGSNVYVGGAFTNVDGRSVRNVAWWNGQQWSDLGGGVNSNVAALTVFRSNVVAGGTFTQAGATDAPWLARWDGTGWSPVGGGVDGPVYALTSARGLLYVGGRFTNAGPIVANGIATWDGSVWRALGPGMGTNNVSVRAIATDGTNVLVGGLFQAAGGQLANNVALWDGASWHSLGDNAENGVLGGPVSALAMRRGLIYVGGQFAKAGTVSALGLACWDGTRWTAFGSGLNHFAIKPAVLALAFQGNALFVGGLFSSAGNKGASGIARWIDEPGLSLGFPRLQNDGRAWLPLTGTTGLRFALESSEDLRTWRGDDFFQGLEGELLIETSSDSMTRFFRCRLEP